MTFSALAGVCSSAARNRPQSARPRPVIEKIAVSGEAAMRGERAPGLAGKKEEMHGFTPPPRTGGDGSVLAQPGPRASVKQPGRRAPRATSTRVRAHDPARRPSRWIALQQFQHLARAPRLQARPVGSSGEDHGPGRFTIARAILQPPAGWQFAKRELRGGGAALLAVQARTSIERPQRCRGITSLSAKWPRDAAPRSATFLEHAAIGRGQAEVPRR